MVRIGARSVSTLFYAQTRAELQRLYLYSLIHGMNYHLSAIAPEFPISIRGAEFDRGAMTAMFNEGYALAAVGEGWRRHPPGSDLGETPLARSGTTLNEVPRGPARVQP